jgi:hypothetical protein
MYVVPGEHIVVFLPGFQKGRAQFLPKKGNCVVARKNVKKFEKLKNLKNL